MEGKLSISRASEGKDDVARRSAQWFTERDACAFSISSGIPTGPCPQFQLGLTSVFWTIDCKPCQYRRSCARRHGNGW